MLSFMLSFVLIGSSYASPVVASDDIAMSAGQSQEQKVHVDGEDYVMDATLYPFKKTIDIIVKHKYTGEIVFEAKGESFDTVST